MKYILSNHGNIVVNHRLFFILKIYFTVYQLPQHGCVSSGVSIERRYERHKRSKFKT